MEIQIILLLKQLSLSLEQYGREQLKSLGISPTQGIALDYLLSQQGRTRYASQLHHDFGISKPAISATLKGLKKKGYVETAVNPEDDRKKQILLTPKAREIEKKINENLLEQQAQLCRGIPEQQLVIFSDVLRAMIRNVKREPVRRDDA